MLILRQCWIIALGGAVYLSRPSVWSVAELVNTISVSETEPKDMAIIFNKSLKAIIC